MSVVSWRSWGWSVVVVVTRTPKSRTRGDTGRLYDRLPMDHEASDRGYARTKGKISSCVLFALYVDRLESFLKGEDVRLCMTLRAWMEMVRVARRVIVIYIHAA
jgi:hypothetical protein